MGLHANGQAHIFSPGEIQCLTNALPGMIEAAQATGGRRPETWVLVAIDEAYIHCFQHVPLMKRLDKHRSWGTDDEWLKGEDFFKARR